LRPHLHVKCVTQASQAFFSKNRCICTTGKNRRKYLRVPASFLVNCLQADLTRVGGKALNLSPGGIAIETNCPICVGEELTVEFVEPKTLNAHNSIGLVVWRQFHGDSCDQTETLFTAGIKFLNLNDSF
jgi:hypothetical protein